MKCVQFYPKPYALRCRAFNLELGKKTYVMGILNVTPDSFSDGGDHNTVKLAIEHALEMIKEGVDIIDVGGESTRPGSAEVTLEDELQRVIPVIKALKEDYGIQVPISIDTYKAEVARQAILAGADLLNDVWGFQREPEMANVAAEFGVPAIVMHNQEGTVYESDIMAQMLSFFEKTIEIAKAAGMDISQLVIDPGIGFGKNFAQNLEVMGRLSELSVLKLPMLLGTSRKSTIGQILDLPPKERVEGTIATNILGALQGADIIRVHDVKAHVRALKVSDAITRGV